MNDVTLIVSSVAAVLLLIMVCVLIYLFRQQNKLQQDVQALTKKLQGNVDDVAGLCSAAVSVDQRLMTNESRLNGVLEAIREPPAYIPDEEEPVEAEQPQGYELAIEKIRSGANVDDLVKSCGLTRDEAVLLVRLHGR